MPRTREAIMKIIENKNSDLGILLFFEKSQNKYAI